MWRSALSGYPLGKQEGVPPRQADRILFTQVVPTLPTVLDR